MFQEYEPENKIAYFEEIVNTLERDRSPFGKSISYIVATEGWAEIFAREFSDNADVLNLRPDVSACLRFLLIQAKCQLGYLEPDDWQLISSDENFIEFISALYQLPTDLGIIRLDIHATGSTSLIFKCLTRKFRTCALKLIQPIHFHNSHIRRLTLNYAADHGLHTLHSPAIYSSSDTHIIMEFIEGENLNYFIQRHRKASSGDGVPLQSAFNIIQGLLQALNYYRKLTFPVYHGDLTPFNIIVSARDEKVYLIDFGSNYLLRDHAGSQSHFSRIYSHLELFIAPEIVAGQPLNSSKADMYSAAMITLELLNVAQLRKEDIGPRLRSLWKNPQTRGVAEIIEDLTEEEPRNRAIEFGDDEECYSRLMEAVKYNFEVYEGLQRTQKSGFWGYVGNFLKLDVASVLSDAKEIYSHNKSNSGRITKKELAFLYVNAICCSVIISSFVIVNYLSLGPIVNLPFSFPVQEAIEKAMSYLNIRYSAGDFWDNIPGRAVALTFGMIAGRYYSNIFAFVVVNGPSDTQKFLTNGFLRLNSISYFIPIMYAMVVDASAWPYCAFFGTLFPAINNFLCGWVCKDGAKLGLVLLSSEKKHSHEASEFLQRYNEWGNLMLLYSISLLTIGILLDAGYLVDEKMYAFLVCSINILKIYRLNCGREAPEFAGNISRLFYAARRARILTNRSNM